MPQTDEIAWRHAWLKSVLIDSGKPSPTKIQRHTVTRRMSLVRRQEKLHRMRATLEPPRGPKCPVPPWSRTVREPRTPRLSHFSELVCTKRKGQGSGDRP
jgi:hypothetical protein